MRAGSWRRMRRLNQETERRNVASLSLFARSSVSEKRKLETGRTFAAE
jgi:hypothetical protein